MRNIYFRVKLFGIVVLVSILTTRGAAAAAAAASTTETTVTANFEDSDDYVPPPHTTEEGQHDKFLWTLSKHILKANAKNAIFSPFSVQFVLLQLMEAVGNKTQTQMELLRALTPNNTRNVADLRAQYTAIGQTLKEKSSHYTFNLETRMFTDELIQAEQKYAAILNTSYGTDIVRLPFANTRRAAQVINDWCSNVTNGRLQQLISADNIRNSVLLLVNAIYFNGLWRYPFNAPSFQLPFFTTLKTSMTADYMERTEFYYYYADVQAKARILRLPYRGQRFSLFILLPDVIDGLDTLIDTLPNPKRMQRSMTLTKVKVTLPKFRFTHEQNMKDVLIRLGIRTIFTRNASLPGLARGMDVAGHLMVSNIFQNAGIDVNEEGTEAFAATAVEITNKFGGSDQIVEFNVNHPFIFLIAEETTGSLIFAGKVIEPISM